MRQFVLLLDEEGKRVEVILSIPKLFTSPISHHRGHCEMTVWRIRQQRIYSKWASCRSSAAKATMISGVSMARFRRPTETCLRMPVSTSRVTASLG
ncbi:hypothetical protein AXFE_05960 [Acidithrix ferrooxidans]|uniref:Uncharacterized protein n=1 Tax=Acidithrix ferrooxidans TaxID=1280514 RepID=A0A0D8HN33_9ACTN|nr:hypothetical protein AXFE_05960 [Acidithrix ferrooxidans]